MTPSHHAASRTGEPPERRRGPQQGDELLGQQLVADPGPQDQVGEPRQRVLPAFVAGPQEHGGKGGAQGQRIER